MLNMLIVDDDPDVTTMLETAFETEFNVVVSASGEEAIARFSELKPGIVLLDIGLPDMDGFAVCKQLKALDSEDSTSIVFVSGHNTLEEKIKSYAYGGDDFITKPFEIEELIAKVKLVSDFTKEKKELAEQNRQAQNMAMQSMTEAFQYGNVVTFFRNAISCEDYNGLAGAFFESMNQLGLVTCLQMRCDPQITLAAESQPCSPIEKNLFEILRDRGRLFHFGTRTMVNDMHVSFLIKNMPVEDEGKYGRFNDLLAIISEGLEAAFQSIRRKDALSNIFEDIDFILNEVKHTFSGEDNVTIRAVEELTQVLPEIQNSFHFLDLSEEQESHFDELLERGAENVESVLSNVQIVQKNLEEVAGKVKQANDD